MTREGLRSLEICGFTNWCPWGKFSNRFLSTLDNLVYSSGHLNGGQSQGSLETLRVSKLVVFPVTFLVHSAASIRNLDIQHIAFMEIPEMLHRPLKQLRISGVDGSYHLSYSSYFCSQKKFEVCIVGLSRSVYNACYFVDRGAIRSLES